MIDTLDSPYIHAANADTFPSLVLENSSKGPVLVNFWSKKAGPCLRLYPLLDKMIHDLDGRILLVNVDADSEVKVTKEYGVASVPTLKLFRKGQVVETRHGFQSEKDLSAMVQFYIARESDQVIAQAVALFSDGEPDKAYELLAETIVEDPINPRLPLAMCKLLKHERRYDEALKLLGSLPDDVRHYDEILQFQALLSFFAEAGQQDAPTIQAALQSDPDNLELKQALAVRLVTEGQYELALIQLGEMLDIDVAYNGQYAQKTMIRLFSVLGDDPLISQYRHYLKRSMH